MNITYKIHLNNSNEIYLLVNINIYTYKVVELSCLPRAKGICTHHSISYYTVSHLTYLRIYTDIGMYANAVRCRDYGREINTIKQVFMYIIYDKIRVAEIRRMKSFGTTTFVLRIVYKVFLYRISLRVQRRRLLQHNIHRFRALHNSNGFSCFIPLQYLLSVVVVWII